MPEEISIAVNEVKWLISYQTRDMYSQLTSEIETDVSWMRNTVFPDSTVVKIQESEEECKDCALNDYCREMERTPGYVFTLDMRPGQKFQLGYLKLLHRRELDHMEKTEKYKIRSLKTEHFYMRPVV